MAMLNNQMVLSIPFRMNDFSDWLRVDGMNNRGLTGHVEDNGDDDKPTYPYIYELMEMVEIS
jgi:hypothetical protein